MRRFLNTLFVSREDVYLALENENVTMLCDNEIVKQMPLRNLENIICFSYKGASPALMGECAKLGIGLCFMSPRGRFLARINGMNPGNVLLRKKQYRVSEDGVAACHIARNFIVGKLFNARMVLERAKRDHPLSIDAEKIREISQNFKGYINAARQTEDLEVLRGVEGNAAKEYFAVFDNLILQNKQDFKFTGRSKRPPLDKVNAMLSFAYTILAHDTASALESVGLDAYVGFMHADRPGRESLALDLMEELRSIYADRFVLTLINNRVIKPTDFETRENGAVLLNEEGRKSFLSSWQEKKREQIQHPFLGEKIAWGQVPYAQALLLARHLRGDMEEYPAFLWK